MYKLYYSPGACSLAIHVLLNELNQPVEMILKKDVKDFAAINPTGAVPVLDDDGVVLPEGAAIVLHLLEKHKSPMLPASGPARANALKWLMFANATMHPAYSKMFFVKGNVTDKTAQEQAAKAAAEGLTKLWAIVDAQLAKTLYVCGQEISAADILLSVYANWAGYFTVEVPLGVNVKRMLKNVSSRPSFQKALKAEQVEYKAAA
jgi:glutathione S-transferase